jgi:hypothetical protein
MWFDLFCLKKSRETELISVLMNKKANMQDAEAEINAYLARKTAEKRIAL